MKKISLTKNTAGDYLYCVRLKDAQSGKQIRYAGNTYTSNRREAEQFAADRIQPILQARTVEECLALRMRVLAGLRTIQINDMIDRAHTMISSAGKKRQQAYRSRILRFVDWTRTNHPRAEYMHEVTPSIAQSFVDSLKPISPSTVGEYATILSRVFDSLANDAGITSNPFNDLTLPRGKPHSQSTFTMEHINTIFSQSQSEARTLYIIGICTGLRLKDACLLKWQAVNITGEMITVTTAKTKTKVRIPIMPPLRIALESLPRESEYVMPEIAARYARNSALMTGHNAKFLKSCGIKTHEIVNGKRKVVYGFHACRHTFAYLAGIAGIQMPIVQSILGHMDARMTELYQRHTRDEDARQALRVLGDVLSR